MKTAVLFIHGFMGAHGLFPPMGKRIDGADIFYHILPGHESTLADFKKSGAVVWQASVDGRLAQLRKEYDRIVLAGHSMGGLLAVCAAVKNPDKIVGVTAICFPIKVTLKLEWISLCMGATKPYSEGEDPRVTAARRLAGVKIGSVGEYLSTLPQNFEFLKTTKAARKSLRRLQVPLTVINSAEDEIVNPSVPDFVRGELPAARVILQKKSSHYLFDADEETFIVETVARMVMGQL